MSEEKTETIDEATASQRYAIDALISIIAAQMDFHQNLTIALLEASSSAVQAPEAVPADAMRQRPMSPELAKQVEDAIAEYGKQFPMEEQKMFADS